MGAQRNETGSGKTNSSALEDLYSFSQKRLIRKDLLPVAIRWPLKEKNENSGKIVSMRREAQRRLKFRRLNV